MTRRPRKLLSWWKGRACLCAKFEFKVGTLGLPAGLTALHMTEMVGGAQRGSNGRLNITRGFPDDFMKDRFDVNTNAVRCIRLLSLLPVESEGSLHEGEMLDRSRRTVTLHKLF